MVESDTFEQILSRHGLERSDLHIDSPTAVVRNEIAAELNSWEDCQRLCRAGFRFPDAVIATIARENKQESERKIASMDTWKKRNNKSATYLDLAQALHFANFDNLVDKLCVKYKDRTLEADGDSPVGERKEPVAGPPPNKKPRLEDNDAAKSMSDDNASARGQSKTKTLTRCMLTASPMQVQENVNPTDVNPKQGQGTSTPDSSKVSSLSSESSSSLSSSRNTENQSMTLCFSETMSDELYYSYLKKEGLSTKDCDILKQNGFGAKIFVNGFGEKEIESSELNFTYGGKLLLRRLVKQLSKDTNSAVLPHSANVQIGDLTIKRYEIIGNGAFGSVFKGTWKQKPCAVKVLHALGQEVMTGLPAATKGEGHEKLLSKFKTECQFMKEYEHPNIVRCYDTLIYPECNLPVLVMELMDTSLCKFIGDKLDLVLDIQISISRDVASALKFLHSNDIVHRDLCGDNILLNCNQEVPVAKISDFGMSRVIMKCGSLTHSMTAIGRRGFLPPESPANYDSSLDVFMFGVVMIMIASKVSKVEDKQQRKSCLKEIPNRHPLKQIISQCISEKKEERPTAAKVHELLTTTEDSDFSENESLKLYVGRGSLTKLIGEKVIRSGDFSEVLVSTLERRGSVVGLFFSAHWCPPSRSFTPLLISWYNNFKKTSNGDFLNIIFISSDANEGEYISYFQEMPWYSLHYNHREKKNELSTKFKVGGIPTLVFVDGKTGKLITREGRGIVVSDSDGNKFPWDQPSFSEVIVDCKFIDCDKRETTWNQLKGQIVGIFFSLPWSKHRTFKAFSSELAIVYNKLKESGNNFEIIYVNCDKDEGAWQEYIENIPWMALPFGDKHTEDLITALDVTQAPALILLDENCDVITTRGCNSVRSDPLGTGFPWYINSLTKETAEDIPETPSLIWFIPKEMKNAAKEILEYIAKIYLSTCADMKVDVNLLFFLSWRSRDDEKYVDYIKTIATLPDHEPLLIILDMSEGKVYTCDSHEVTNDCVKTFINDYFQNKLTGKGLVPMTVSQRRHIEADVLETCHTGVSEAMKINVDAELFGTLLIQYDFASETVLSTPMFSPEIPSDFRIDAILQVVESTIREASSSRRARELFNTLIEIIAEPLGCVDIAQSLVTTCKMKDPTYKSPLISRAKEKGDTCPMDLPHDAKPNTKTGYDFDVEDHHLSLLEYIVASERKQVKLYNQIAHRWRNVGEILGLENCELDSIRHDHPEDHGKVVAVLQRWIENANNLPRRDKYPMSWTGLVKLLWDCDLGILAETVDKALKADVNSVKGNMS